MDAGLGFLTEDRKESGCFLLLDMIENMQTAILRQRFTRALASSKRREIEALCLQQQASLRVRTPDLVRADASTSPAAISRRC